MHIKQRLRLSKSLLMAICTLLLGLYSRSVQAQLPGGTYTINSNVASGGTNFQSFNEAINAMYNGITGPVTFNVVPGSGPYSEPLVLENRIGSSASKPIIFNCNGVTLSYSSIDSDHRDIIAMDSVDYVTFDNLKIVSTADPNDNGSYSFCFHLYRDCDHNTIKNCTLISPTNAQTAQNIDGIVINGAFDVSVSQGPSYCDSNLIQNNYISGGNSGVTLSSVPSGSDIPVFMKGNQIIGNTIINAKDACIELFYTEGTLIQGNDLQGGGYFNDVIAGMKVYEDSKMLRVIGNRFHNFHMPTTGTQAIYGVDLASTGAAPENEILFANNLFYDFQSKNVQYGIECGDPANLKIYHNTFVFDDNVTAGATGSTYPFYNNSYPVVDIKNNIFYVSRVTTGKNYGIYCSTNINTFTSNRNDFYIPSGGATNATGYFAGTTGTTLAAWQTASKNDYNSVSINPKFQDPANFIYIPTDSALDNLGEYVNINTDITNANRNNTHPDIGAYEFLTPACTLPITAGTSVLTPTTTVCQGDAVGINLDGNTFGANQTYTWQTSTTANGTFTNASAALAHPAYGFKAGTTLYYRAAITCGTTTVYSTPVQLFVNPSFPAGTYTINSAVATGGTNFKTYNEAVASLSCGITGPVVFNVVAGSGPYNEQVIVKQVNGMSATNTITFNGNGTTLTYLSTSSAEKAVFKLNGADYVILDSIKIVPLASAASQYGGGVQMLNGATHNIVRRCIFDMSASLAATSTLDIAGVVISSSTATATFGNGSSSNAPSFSDSNTITNNTMTGGIHGIAISTSDALRIKGTIITNNVIKDFRYNGIYLINTANTLVEGNDVSRPTRANTTVGGLIYMTATNSALTISKNRLHNSMDGVPSNTGNYYGIYMTGSHPGPDEPVVITNNAIYNMNGKGTIYGIYNDGCDNTKLYHNTISLDDTSSNASGITSGSILTRGYFHNGTPTGVEFIDNNITVKRLGKGIKVAIYVATAGTDVKIDYNNVFMNSPQSTSSDIRATGSFGTTYYYTLANWKAAGPNDANSLGLWPGYVAPASGNYTPSIQALDNKGINVGVATDIYNQARHRLPDMGAFEFSYCLSLGTITVSVDTAGADMVRFSWNAVTNATGYLVSTDGTNFVTPSSGATGLTHTLTGLTAGTDVNLYVKVIGTTEDCPTITSPKTTAHTICLTLSGKPVVTVDAVGVTTATFKWNAITNATGYKVSTNNTVFTNPSSGPTGLTHTLTGLTGGTDYSLWVIALGTSQYCPNDTSLKATVTTTCATLGTTPTVTVDSVGTSSVKFSWNAVTNATAYRVSTDGINYSTPSSGSTGLTHTVTGLAPGATVTLTVQVIGSSENCPKVYSTAKSAQTYSDQFYVPNTFSPNGNGKSDVFVVHSFKINTMKLMIFNQWGEKVFESSNQKDGWDGTYKGKQQPVGVYVYVLSATMTDGTSINKKGTINLIR